MGEELKMRCEAVSCMHNRDRECTRYQPNLWIDAWDDAYCMSYFPKNRMRYIASIRSDAVSMYMGEEVFGMLRGAPCPDGCQGKLPEAFPLGKCKGCKYLTHYHHGMELGIAGYRCGRTGEEIRAVAGSERRSKWVRKQDEVCYWYECMVCHEQPPRDRWGQEWHSNFCPSCGAEMDFCEEE